MQRGTTARNCCLWVKNIPLTFHNDSVSKAQQSGMGYSLFQYLLVGFVKPHVTLVVGGWITRLPGQNVPALACHNLRIKKIESCDNVARKSQQFCLLSPKVKGIRENQNLAIGLYAIVAYKSGKMMHDAVKMTWYQRCPLAASASCKLRGQKQITSRTKPMTIAKCTTNND